MSSSSASPIALFESLTIDPEMSPTNEDIRSRALEVRDILSSFDRNILPSEFKPQIFTQLDRPFQIRPPSHQWTIQEDLAATLLQWGAYNDQAYELLKGLQSDSTLSRCFYEKLGRRFHELLNEYDRLLHEPESTIRIHIQRISEGFRDVVAAVKEDREYRQTSQEAIAARLLDALINICQRHVDIYPPATAPVTPRRGTRRAPASPEGPANLYEALIKNPLVDPSVDLFMVDVLETFPATTFRSLESEHTNLMQLLDINHAPSAYKYRIGRLPSGAESSTAAGGLRSVSRQPSHEGGARPIPTPLLDPLTSVGTSQSVQGQSQPGSRTQSASAQTSTTRSKRSAEETSPTTKRGRKKSTR